MLHACRLHTIKLQAKKWLERVLKERRLPKFLGTTASEVK